MIDLQIIKTDFSLGLWLKYLVKKKKFTVSACAVVSLFFS